MREKMHQNAMILEMEQSGEKLSQPISRVLSWTIIHLGITSPLCSSDLPESNARHAERIPIWSCSRWGLPCHHVLPLMRCALTAPFHPYRHCRRSALCCTFRRLAPPRDCLAPCLEEPGLSSPVKTAAIVWLTHVQCLRFIPTSQLTI